MLSGDFALNKLNGIDENTNSDSALLAQQYRHNVTEISQRNMEIYALVAKCDQYAEWKWVVAGIIAACMVIAIVVWIYVLAVMLVLLMVITAFLATHPAYDDHYYNDQVSREEDPWIARIFERLWNKIKEKENEANARISTLSSEVLALQAENDTILKQLFSPEDICQIN